MSIRQLITGTALALVLSAGAVPAQTTHPAADTAVVAAAVEGMMPEVVGWRRDFHRHPELGFAEVRTAAIIAAHLESLGMEVRTGVGRTGVVGILRGSSTWARRCRWPTPAATTPIWPC